MGRVAVELTESQERRIARYLREVGAHLQDLPSDDRERALSRLNARIERELTRTGDPVGDDYVDRVLAAYGSPASQAARIREADSSGPSTMLAWKDRLWLGVCSGLAKYFNLDPTVVRALAVLLGLVPFLLPILLWVYVGFYFAQYRSVKGQGLDAISWLKVVQSVFVSAGVTIVLHFCARFFLFCIEFAHRLVVGAKLVYGANWGWLAQQGTALFLFVFLTGVPLSAIAALPVSPSWSGTLKKVVQAVLAVYAVALCFGVASALVGAILANVDQLPSSPGIEALRNIAP